MWHDDPDYKKPTPIVIEEIGVGRPNQIKISNGAGIGRNDTLSRANLMSITILVENIIFAEDLFEDYYLLDVYVISNAGGTENASDILNVGDELKRIGSTYEET